jgi:putative DNA primase/helicase
MTAVLLEAALDFARRGIAVFPLHYPVERDGKLWCTCGSQKCSESTNAAKHPYARLAPRGLLDAVTDPRVIRRWWGPGVPYNLAIRTGEESGVVVVDVDPRHEGDKTLADLEGRFGALPETWRFLTGGDGEHILFKYPGYRIKNGAGSLGEGLDVRGDGGYIVAPPSRHVSGRYYAMSVDHHPDKVELADMPVWLAAMLQPAAGPRTSNAAMPETWRKLVAEGVGEGRRNDAVARLAGLLLRRGLDPFVTLDLVKCWNTARCRPPLDEAEIVRTVNSIAAREIGLQGASHG